MIRDPKRTNDGFTTLEGGMDSNVAPSLIQRNQVAFAVNTVFRYGFAETRPGWRKIPLNWQDKDEAETAFQTGQFQGAAFYDPPNGSETLAVSVGGRLFIIRPAFASSDTANNLAQEISIPNDRNNNRLTQCWMVQAEDFLIVQDGQSLPVIYNGSVARRADVLTKEVPVGRAMAYGMGRLWVSNGRDYVAGDIVGGPSGTPAYQYRDAVLKFTENDYLNEGGAFTVPLQSGNITAMKFIGNLNTVLGQGELIVFTQRAVFTTYVPPDRTTWKNLSIPLQRVAMNTAGGTSSESAVGINSDLLFRANDGIRSLRFSVLQDTNTWGSTPLSAEMRRILDGDDRSLLQYSSAVKFDNRLLVTCSPHMLPGHGVYHKGLIALDFDPVGSLGNKKNPAYDGLWTGLNILQLVQGTFNGQDRCFAFTLNADEEVELWELTTDLTDDDYDSTLYPIRWSIESGEFPFDDGRKDLKRLETGDLWIDSIRGSVSVAVQYRPDNYPLWLDWSDWTECATVGSCSPGCTTPNALGQEQYRARVGICRPEHIDDPTDNKPLDLGYGFQTRLEFQGKARVRQFRISATRQQEFQQGPFK